MRAVVKDLYVILTQNRVIQIENTYFLVGMHPRLSNCIQHPKKSFKNIFQYLSRKKQLAC